jgi:LAO/AO transport system kinase
VGLADEVIAGDVRAIARALTLVERGGAGAEEVLAALAGQSRRTATLGVTGAPGVGKSTLVQALGLALRRGGARVAVLAVDPSSPFSGGALLGDRIRMAALTAEGAYVRSMATRGALGGLTAATADALDVLQAAPFDWIVVETVGVGQDEVDVAGEVDTVCVVTVPGLGDDVQAVKAGLYEVADLFVVNKADTGMADEVAAVLEAMLEVAPPGPWRVPVLKVSARDGDGVGNLLEVVREHQAFLGQDGRRAGLRRQRALRRLERVVGAMAWAGVQARGAEVLDRVAGQVAGGEVDVYRGARLLLEGLRREG